MYDLEDGRGAAVSVVGNEGLVGMATLMGGGTPGRRIVLSAGQGYRMRAADLMAEFLLGGSVSHLLLRYAQAEITQIGQTVVCNRCHTIESRLCRFVLLMLDRLTGEPEIAMTHDLLASVLGVRRERITETAIKLQQLGILRYQHGRVTELDRAGLERRSCECHAVVKKEYQRLLP